MNPKKKGRLVRKIRVGLKRKARKLIRRDEPLRLKRVRSEVLDLIKTHGRKMEHYEAENLRALSEDLEARRRAIISLAGSKKRKPYLVPLMEKIVKGEPDLTVKVNAVMILGRSQTEEAGEFLARLAVPAYEAHEKNVSRRRSPADWLVSSRLPSLIYDSLGVNGSGPAMRFLSRELAATKSTLLREGFLFAGLREYIKEGHKLTKELKEGFRRFILEPMGDEGHKVAAFEILSAFGREGAPLVSEILGKSLEVFDKELLSGRHRYLVEELYRYGLAGNNLSTELKRGYRHFLFAAAGSESKKIDVFRSLGAFGPQAIPFLNGMMHDRAAMRPETAWLPSSAADTILEIIKLRMQPPGPSARNFLYSFNISRISVPPLTPSERKRRDKLNALFSAVRHEDKRQIACYAFLTQPKLRKRAPDDLARADRKTMDYFISLIKDINERPIGEVMEVLLPKRR